MTSTPATSRPSHPSVRGDRLLRRSFQVDAAVTGLNGAGYLLAAPILDDVLGLPADLLRGLGVFLIVFGVGVWAVGSRTSIPTGPGVAVVAVNVVWAAASVAVAVAGWHTPTSVGTIWIVLQAALVAAFAGFQWLGLHRRLSA